MTILNFGSVIFPNVINLCLWFQQLFHIFLLYFCTIHVIGRKFPSYSCVHTVCLKMLIAIPASRKIRAPGLPEHLLNKVFHPEIGSWSFSGTLLTLINRGQTFSSFHLFLLVMHACSCAHAPAHRNFVGSAISSPAMVGIACLHHSANEHAGKMDR